MTYCVKNEDLDLIIFAVQDVRVETCAVAPCVMVSGAVVLLNVVVVLTAAVEVLQIKDKTSPALTAQD